MCLEKDYKRILTYAKAQVDKRSLSCEPEELIADTFLELTNCEYEIQLFLKTLANISIKEKFSAKNNVAFGVSWNVKSGFIDMQTCIGCKEVLPAAMFRLDKRDTGKTYLDTKCKDCMAKDSLARTLKRKELGIKKIRKDRVPRIKNKIAVKKFVENNREQWNAYNRERMKKEKENLSDAYCRKRLLAKYDIQFLKDNPFVIEDYRKKLSDKRSNKNLVNTT